MKILKLSILVFSVVISVVQSSELNQKEIDKWQEYGIYSVYINDWKSSNVNSPKEAREWLDLHYDKFQTFKNAYNYAKGWKSVGITTPVEAKKWMDVEVESSFFNELKFSGINSPEDVKPWINAQVSVYNIHKWKNVGISTPNEAHRWISSLYANCGSISNAYQFAAFWRAKGVQIPEEVKSCGMDSSKSMIEEKPVNVSPFDMSLSQCADLTSQLKQAEANKNYNKVMDVGGMIFLGCDKHLSKDDMGIVLEAIDRAEKKLK